MNTDETYNADIPKENLKEYGGVQVSLLFFAVVGS